MLGGKKPCPMQAASISERYHILAATDSAAAATACATGYKTDNGNIAWLPGDPDGGESVLAAGQPSASPLTVI